MRLRHWRQSLVALAGMLLMTGPGQAGDSSMRPGPQDRLVPVVNQDQLAGMWKQFKGELKQKWAEFTDDDLMFIEGRIDTLEGKILERYGDRREEVKRWVDEWFERHGEKASQS